MVRKNLVYFDEFGVIQDKNFVLKDKLNVTVDELIKTNKTWLNKYMSN